MGIAAIANDYLTRPLRSAAGKETTPVISETESFGQKLQAETEKNVHTAFWRRMESYSTKELLLSVITSKMP